MGSSILLEWLHSANHETLRWMQVCIPKYWIKRWLHSLKELCRRHIFQHDNDPIHTAKITRGFKEKRGNYDLAKCDTWLETRHFPSILKLEVKQKNPSSKELLKRFISEEWYEHVITDLCKTDVIHAQEDRIWVSLMKGVLTFVAVRA